MNTAEQILVVFLSTALAIFLVIAIVAAIHAVRLIKKLESLAETAEAIGQTAQDFTERIAALTSLRGVLEVLLGKKSSSKRNKDREYDDEETN